MKKLLLLTAVSLTCLHFNAEAMDSPLSENEKTNPKVPTGFFNKLLAENQLGAMKLKRAEEYVTPRINKYALFLERIRATYFTEEITKDTEPAEVANFINSFFQGKVKKLEQKYAAFKLALETNSKSAMTPLIGTYNGEFHNQPEMQVTYAQEKVESWNLILDFVSLYPITKVSTNPILQREIEHRERLILERLSSILIISTEKLGKLEKVHNNCYRIDDVLGSQISLRGLVEEAVRTHPMRPLNDMVDNSYHLKNHAEEHLKKWKARIGGDQKKLILRGRVKTVNDLTSSRLNASMIGTNATGS